MLTDTRIRNAKPKEKPYKLTDAKGLYLEIKPTGSKLWRYRYRIAGKENVFAAGEYCPPPDLETSEQAAVRRQSGRLTLADARVGREEWRGMVKRGVHPSHQRKIEQSRQVSESRNTFEAVLHDWVATRHWAESSKSNRMSQINNHLLPAFGSLPIRQITSSQILGFLRSVERKQPDIRQRKYGKGASIVGGGSVVLRLRQIISGVFDHAISTLRADNNPAAPVKGAFKIPKTIHKVPLTREQIGKLMRALDEYPGHFQTAAALKLLWYTLVRPGEMSGAWWSEFDLEAATWTIPAARMKMREEHVLPLPAQAIELLRQLYAITGPVDGEERDRPLFPHRNYRDRPMTTPTLNAGINRMKLDFKHTPHAARTTGSTLLNEMNYRPDVIERQLAHQERNAVRRAYNRANYMDERRAMMQQWADLTDEMAKSESKVTTMRRVAAS